MFTQCSLTAVKNIAYYLMALRFLFIIFNMDAYGLCGYMHVNVHAPARVVGFLPELGVGAWNSNSPKEPNVLLTTE